MFNPQDPNCVIGSTTTGYILVWDVRAKKEPVSGYDRRDRSQPWQKSCLAKNGHDHPVHSMQVIGNSNVHDIVTVSNNGHACIWKPKMLNEPRDHFMLEVPQTMKDPSQAKTATNPIMASASQAAQNRVLATAHCM